MATCSPSHDGFASRALLSLAAHGAAHYVLDAAAAAAGGPLARTYRAMSRADKHQTMMSVLCSVTSVGLFAMYLQALTGSEVCDSETARTLEDAGLATTGRNRWHGSTLLSGRALEVHIGLCLYEVAVFVAVSKGPEFFVHHVIVLVNYALCLHSGEVHGLAAVRPPSPPRRPLVPARPAHAPLPPRSGRAWSRSPTRSSLRWTCSESSAGRPTGPTSPTAPSSGWASWCGAS